MAHWINCCVTPKWQNGGIGVYTGRQTSYSLQCVHIGLSPVPRYLPLCPASCARSAQKFSGKENKNNIKKTKSDKSSLCCSSLTCTAAGFGCATVLNMLKEAHP